MTKTSKMAILAFFLLLFIFGCGEQIKLNVSLQEGTYKLSPLNRYIPYYYKSLTFKDLMTINRSIPSKYSIKNDLNLSRPYNAVIRLGNLDKEFLMVFDIENEEKKLYIDENGDYSIVPGEQTYTLYRQKIGEFNIYSTSQPIRISVPYGIENYQEIHDLFLAIMVYMSPRNNLFKLHVVNRHWLAGEGMLDQEKVFFAVVDQNGNGKYNDDKDIIYFDLDKDGRFAREEGMTYRGLQTVLDVKNEKYQVVLDSPYPQQIKVVKIEKGGKNR